VAPELLFDQPPGELFVTRVAGNFVNDDGLASLEYGVKFLGIPLIMVLGHSDNQPIRSVRFPSNWHLSQARAEAALVPLGAGVGDPARLKAEGRGDAEPIADNSTAEGREQNRRIELVLPREELLRR
jgi:flagellar motor protein MotB